MIPHKAHVFKRKPDGAARRKPAKACGCTRLRCRKSLDCKKAQREKDQTLKVSRPELCTLLPEELQEPIRREPQAPQNA